MTTVLFLLSVAVQQDVRGDLRSLELELSRSIQQVVSQRDLKDQQVLRKVAKELEALAERAKPRPESSRIRLDALFYLSAARFWLRDAAATERTLRSLFDLAPGYSFPKDSGIDTDHAFTALFARIRQTREAREPSSPTPSPPPPTREIKEPKVKGSGTGKKILAGVTTGGLIAAAVLAARELAPRADTGFSMNPDCASPCALVLGATAATFTVTKPDAANFRYDWDFGDGGRGSGITTTYVFRTEGPFTVRLQLFSLQNFSGTPVASAPRSVLVRSLAGVWSYEDTKGTRGSVRFNQSSSSVSGTYALGPRQGSLFGEVRNPRVVRLDLAFGDGSLDGEADSVVSRITGTHRPQSGALAQFTMSRVQ